MMGSEIARGEFGIAGVARRTIVRGEGAYVWDATGGKYVDLGASLGVANLGHSHPRIVEAIQRQAGELVFVSSGYTTRPRIDFVDRLLSLMPPRLARVFLSNSGTEAMETAIKLARSATGRTEFVAMMRGFHGRTMGALSATWRSDLRRPFEPLVPGFAHVPLNDIAKLEATVTDRTAGVILELVQGEGGIHVADPEFVRAARAACDAHGAKLIFDEIQTGMGRTGRRWAFERYGIHPDILALAKSLAGGIPIGATITTTDVEAKFQGTLHSTFGGNPIACAAGVAALDVLVNERIDERAERLGIAGLERLRGLANPKIREVRGLGMMIGVELRERAAPYLEELRRRGYLASAAGPEVIRLLPPIPIAEADWGSALATIDEALRDGR